MNEVVGIIIDLVASRSDCEEYVGGFERQRLCWLY